MSVINKFNGEWGREMSWLGARSRRYHGDDVAGVTENWLIGKKEKAKNFAIRYYEVDVNGCSKEEEHPHDHGIVILRGHGQVLLDDAWHDFATGDVIYIEPDIRHQLVNKGEEPMGFLCVIPAVRRKKEKDVWAEEGLEFAENK